VLCCIEALCYLRPAALGIISAAYLLRQSPDAGDPALATVPDMPAGPYVVRRTVVSNRPEAGEYSEGLPGVECSAVPSWAEEPRRRIADDSAPLVK
jgi:hypothetical protein